MTLTIKEPSPMDTVTKPAPGTPEASTDQNSRSNPVCLELAVTIRSLPGEKGDVSAKPIREEGRTVIVFDGGAVLRISSSLPPGQSVILSNQGRDVVCRVVNARGLPTVKGYIEVEFAEQVNDFWGIHRTGGQPVAQPSAPAPVVKPPVAAVPPPPVAAKKMPVPPPAPRSTAPAPPETKGAKGNAPQFEDIAGLVRMSAPPATRVKKAEPASNIAAPKIAESPARPSPEAPKSAPPNTVSQREEEQNLVSGAWESAPTSGRKSIPSDSVIAKDMFSSAGTASISSEGGSQAKIPLIAAAAAVVLLGIGGGWYFMHRGSSVSTPTPISAASQPSSSLPVSEAKAPDPAPVAATPAVNSPVATPAAPAAAPVASTSATAAPPAAAQTARRAPNNVAASQPVAPAPRNQPALNLNMSAPTVASRNAGRLVDGSVPNIGDPVAANPIIATTSGASLPSIARADNPPAPPITAPAATAPARTIREPKLISDPRLSYPATARQTKVEGDVLVTADVDATGKVKSAKAVSGPALLRVGAEDTVKGWKYEPATINGRPVATQVTVKLEFRLK